MNERSHWLTIMKICYKNSMWSIDLVWNMNLGIKMNRSCVWTENSCNKSVMKQMADTAIFLGGGWELHRTHAQCNENQDEADEHSTLIAHTNVEYGIECANLRCNTWMYLNIMYATPYTACAPKHHNNGKRTHTNAVLLTYYIITKYTTNEPNNQLVMVMLPTHSLH